MSDNEMVVGRIVHYKYHGACRAAIIVKVWSPETVNLVWFGNQATDYESLLDRMEKKIVTNPLLGIAGVTSVIQGEADGQWHWPRECQNK